MSAQTTHRARARRLLVVVLVLVLTGAGAAAAYWTATTQLRTTASAATTGLEQQVLPSEGESPLGITYTSETSTAAGAVSLTNTGSRAAEYTLTVHATTTHAEALTSALQLAAGALAEGRNCTHEISLATSGTGATPLTVTGSLGAGGTIDLCLQTTLPADAAAEHPDATLSLSLTSSLRYAEGDAWTVTAGPATITQTVGPRESTPEQPEEPALPGAGDFVSDGARYTLVLDQAYIQSTNIHGVQGIALHPTAGQWESQWRITEAGDGAHYIDLANNEAKPESPRTRWTATEEGTGVVLAAPQRDQDAQKWIISEVGPHGYRIESLARPGYVVTVGAGLWNSTDSHPRRLTLAPVGDQNDQAIAFERVGTPFPEIEQMKPEGSGPWSFALAFTANVQYEAEVSYRVFLAPEDTPEARTAYSPHAVNGWDPKVQFASNSSVLREYAESAEGGLGNTWVHVEQKLPGGEWTPVAVGKIHISPTADKNSQSIGVYPGWR